MNEAILFSEKQRFNQWWFWLLVLRYFQFWKEV